MLYDIVPSLHFAVGAPDFALVLEAAVAAVFPEPAGVEVSEAGAPLLLVIELLLAGAVFDDVGPAAVAAALPAVAGLEASDPGVPVLLDGALLLAGAVLDDVGPAAVAAALPALAGLEVSAALPLAESAVLLTPP